MERVEHLKTVQAREMRREDTERKQEKKEAEGGKEEKFGYQHQRGEWTSVKEAFVATLIYWLMRDPDNKFHPTVALRRFPHFPASI